MDYERSHDCIGHPGRTVFLYGKRVQFEKLVRQPLDPRADLGWYQFKGNNQLARFFLYDLLCLSGYQLGTGPDDRCSMRPALSKGKETIMSISKLSHIMEMFRFGDKELSEEDKKALVEEVLLMTLARATSADCNIDSVEVASVQSIIKEATGSEISQQDIRIAAISDLFKEASLGRYLQKVRSKIDVADRQLVVKSLGQLIRVDGKVSPFEVDFFNGVVDALGMTPAEVAGLSEDTIRR